MKDLREGNGSIRENIMGMYGVKSESEAIERFTEDSTTMMSFLASRIAEIKSETELSYQDLEILGSMIDDLTFGNVDNTPVED